jgi:3-deoxy-D-manno-octulosonic-acid transferase
MKTPTLTLYSAATRALQPVAPALLRRRAAEGKEEPARLGERLGHASRLRPAGRLAWMHAASVGESLSLLPLIARLGAARPTLGVLVTSGTVTSAELLGHRLPAGVVHQYAPVDLPSTVDRFLDHWRPDLAVFVESEIWPNLLTGARRRGTRTALLSARLSEASVRGWARAPRTTRLVLGGFDLTLAQDDEAAARLTRLGARDDGRLNLKFAGDPLPADHLRLTELQAAAAHRPVLLAASTHAGEEEIVAEAFAALPSRPAGPTLVIAPRHPARGPEVSAVVSGDLQSRGNRFGEARVFVADGLGELGLWMRLAAGVFVGGSLLPGVGGHNPLEPARLDRPVASGPYVANWGSVYDALSAVEGCRTVRTANDLARFWTDAMDGVLEAQATAARGVTQTQSGELDVAVERLLALLP